MSWIWLNIPACVVAIAVTVGIPMRVIMKPPEKPASPLSPHWASVEG